LGCSRTKSARRAHSPERTCHRRAWRGVENPALQKRLLRGFLPDIEHGKIGTINIQLDHALDIHIPDIVTPPLQGEPNSGLGERFGFTNVKLELSTQLHDACIYGAEFSSHRFN
jgi:hypothetical protein